METGENPVQCRCCVGGAFAYNYGEIVWSGTGKVGVLRSIHRLFLFFKRR